MAAVGYWTTVEAEREAVKERAGWRGVESPHGRAVFESKAEAFAYVDELKKKGVKKREIVFFDPSDPVARTFTPDEELAEMGKWIKEQRKVRDLDDWGEKAKCPRCGYSQSINDWTNEAYFDLDGRDVAHPIGGDHARCPNCGKLLCIDYDLIEE